MMRCRFIGFCTPRGDPVINWTKTDPRGVHALIERYDPHPLLGAPNGKATITSRIHQIDFQRRYFVTENSLYDFSGG